MESVHLVLQGLGICFRRGMFTREFSWQKPGGVWTLAKFEASLSSWWGVAAGWWAPLFFEGCLFFQVGDCSQVSLWGSNLRVRNPEISQVAKLSIQVHFLQEFQCCFPGGTVLVLRKKHDSSESTGARLLHRISRFWSLEGPSGIKLDNGKCRSPKLMKRMFNMFPWEIIKKNGWFAISILGKTHTHICLFWDVHAIELSKMMQMVLSKMRDGAVQAHCLTILNVWWSLILLG